MRIAITGHRPSKLNNEYDLNGPVSTFLRCEITRALDHYAPVEQVITGMALGVDTLFALIGIAKGLSVLAAIPCDSQERMWPASSQQRYRSILDHPLVTSHVVCPGPYAAWKMQERNKYMVDRCDLLIAVWDGSTGGTGNCVAYATQCGRQIYRINPRDAWRT